MIDDDQRGFRRGPDGELLFYGWAVFGHILPRVGAMDFPCYANGVTAEAIGAAPVTCAYRRRGVVIEWLGRGLCFAFGRVRLATD